MIVIIKSKLHQISTDFLKKIDSNYLLQGLSNPFLLIKIYNLIMT